MQMKVTRAQMAQIIRSKLKEIDQAIDESYQMKDYARMKELQLLFSSYHLVLKHYSKKEMNNV